MANAVYDPETEDKRGYDPQKTPVGDPTDPRGDLRSAESGVGFYNPGGSASGAVASDDLKNSEESGEDSGGESLYNPKDGKQKTRGRFRLTRRKAVIGGGVLAGVTGTSALLFLILLPLKIEHIVSNLESRFFATSQSAIQKETNKMLSRYVVKHVLPSYKRCGSTIDKHCSANVTGNNPVSNLYRSWANARLENKLASDYNIEFKYDVHSNNWYLKAPGTPPGGDNIGSDGSRLDGEFQRSDRGTMRSAISDAMQNETRWKKVMMRYKVGRLLEEKYGIKRCIVFCGVKDTLAGKTDAQKIAAKLYLTQRVITPRDQTLGIVLECLISDCTATDTQPSDSTNSPALAGEPENPETDTQIREGLAKLAATYGASNVDELVNTYKSIAEDGFQKYLLTKALTPIIGEVGAGKVGDAIPIAGWIDLASRIVNTANDSSTTLRKLRYVANASAAVSLYMMYRTYADEIHTGHINATEAGSMTTSLGPGNSGNPNDPELGGTAGAENTPLYSNLIGGSAPPNMTGSLIGAKAYADTANGSSGDYKCNNGKPVPANQTICSEESFGGGNSYANAVHDFLNLPGADVITTLAQAWRSTIGQAFSFVNDIVGGFFSGIAKAADASCGLTFGVGIPPGYCKARDLVNSAASTIMNGVTQWLIPNPFSTNMSGGRTFDMMAAGSDVSGNDYAHTGLGGKALSSQQVAEIVNQQQDEARQSFAHQSFFARMFSTDSQYSLISKVALAVPFGTQAEAQSGFANLTNPLGALAHGFSSIFSARASAAVTAQDDPFGVKQYGYTDGDLAQIGDPEVYWDQHCSDNANNAYMKDNSWNDSASGSQNTDPNTGMPVNATTNPCLLLKATVGAAGGLFDTSNLTSDDMADQNTGTSGTTSTTASGFTNPFPSGWVPNRLDMGYDGTFKNKIVAPFAGTVTYAGPFNGWNGSDGVILKADSDVGLATRSLYFTEGVKPTVRSGQHVDAGTPIADAAPSPYGDSYGQGSLGAIEWGVSQDGPIGSQVDTEAVVMGTGSSAAKQMVLNFSQWAQQKLGLPPPSQTSNAGSP